MGPGNGHQRLHMRAPGAFVGEPLDQAAASGPKHAVPVAQDRRRRHHMLEAVESDQRVEGGVGDRQRPLVAHEKLHLRRLGVVHLGPTRTGAVDRLGIEIDRNDAPRCFVLGQEEA